MYAVQSGIYLSDAMGCCRDELGVGAVEPEHAPREVGVVLGDEVDDWL